MLSLEVAVKRGERGASTETGTTLIVFPLSDRGFKVTDVERGDHVVEEGISAIAGKTASDRGG